MVLPVLALLGLAFFINGGDDSDDASESTDTPNPELNRETFGVEDDTTTGTDVTDYLFLNDGDDMASGGEGDDRIFLGAGADQTAELNADGSFDTAGMEGDDLIRGGEGRDILIDALGSNTIFGDTGYDRMNAIDAEGDEGDEGTNVMLDGQVVLILQGVTEIPDGAIGNSPAPAMFGAVETDPDGNVVNDDLDDEIVINDYASTVFARGGDDTIGFDDDAETADRDMRIFAGAGDDIVKSGTGDDFISGSLGADTLYGGGGADEIDGGYGDDLLVSTGEGLDAADTVFGGAGDDTFVADNGDALTGGDGTDEFNVDMTDADPEAVRIGDFDPATEQLNVTVDVAAGTSTPAATYEANADGISTNVVVEGQVMAVLIGVEPSDLNDTNVTVTTAKA